MKRLPRPSDLYNDHGLTTGFYPRIPTLIIMADNIYTPLLSALRKMHQEVIGPFPGSESGERTKLFILCIGKTGCGTSAFVHHLTGNSTIAAPAPGEEDSGSLASCTLELQWAPLTAKVASELNYDVFIGDAPGLDSTAAGLTDACIHRKIQESLRKSVSHNERYRLGVVLLQDITVGRWSGLGSQQEIAKLKIEGILRHLTFVTTKWPMSGSQVGEYEKRQNDIHGLLGPILSAGSGLDACRTPGDEWRIVKELIKRIESSNTFRLIPFKVGPARPSLWRRVTGGSSLCRLCTVLNCGSLKRRLSSIGGQSSRTLSNRESMWSSLHDMEDEASPKETCRGDEIVFC